MKQLFVSLAAVLCFGFVSGCSSNTGSPSDNSSLHIPTNGTTFQELQTEDNSNLQQSASYMVATSPQSYGGRTNAIGIMQPIDPQDTDWYSFDGNGDVWKRSSTIGDGTQWLQLTYGSQGHSSLSYDNGNATIQWLVDGAGVGSFTINNTSYPTHKVKIRTISHQDGTSVYDTTITDDAFAPGLGIRVTSDQEPYSILGTAQPVEHWKVISYTKK